jgi:hypothetical protein
MITTDQWQAIEKNLEQRVFHTEQFLVEGKTLKVTKTFISKNKLGIAVYINDVIQFSQGVEGHATFEPITHKVWRKRQRALYSPAKVQKLIKQFGKRAVKKHWPEIDKVHTYYDPIFTSASVLIRQFKKIEGLALITVPE